MASGFLPAQERGGVGSESGDVRQSTRRQESVNLGEIPKRRYGDGISIVDGPRDLSGVEGDCHFVFHGQMEDLRQVKVFAVLRIDGAEEPELVLHDRTANVPA